MHTLEAVLLLWLPTLYITFFMFEGLEEQKISCFEDFADDVLSSVWKQGKGPGTENSCWEGAEKIN